MRPESIIFFERLCLGRIAIGTAGSAYQIWRYTLPMLAARGGMPIGVGTVGYLLAGILLLVLCLNLLLLFFIARRASVIAKWIFIVLTVAVALLTARALGAPTILPVWLYLLPIFLLGLDLGAIMLLLQKDSTLWFSGHRFGDEDLDETFS